MADIKDIKALFRAMAEQGIDECEIENADEKITVKRYPKGQDAPTSPLSAGSTGHE